MHIQIDIGNVITVKKSEAITRIHPHKPRPVSESSARKLVFLDFYNQKCLLQKGPTMTFMLNIPCNNPLFTLFLWPNALGLDQKSN